MNKKGIFVILILIISIFAMIGCEKEIPSIETESKFNIVFLEKEIREYIKRARDNESDIDELYRDIVYEPIRSEFTKDNIYTDHDFLDFQHPIKDLDRLDEQLEIFIQEDVVNLVKETLEKCGSLLFNKETTVYIWPFVSDNMLLDGGLTQLDGKILVYINPTISGWKKSLTNILAREYYHSVWMDTRSKEDFTILEYLLLEGRAEAFADTVYPDAERSRVYSLPKIKEKEMWNQIKENLDNKDYYYQKDIMFGGIKGIPILYGYRVGYSIMQEFIKNNPDFSVEEWTSMREEEVLDKSRYEESLESVESKFNITFPEEEIKDYIKIISKSSDELEKNLENQKLFIEIEEEVFTLAEETLEECNNTLFSEEITVHVSVVNPDDMRLRSGGGEKESFAYKGGAVIYINPMTDNWKDLFSRTLAHEYHHSVCMERNAASWDILGWLILEGRAETFAEMLYPDAKVELGRTGTLPLPIITEKEMWDKIKENLNSYNPDYRKDIMFGNIKRIPRLCGYRIGFTIMQEFIKNNPDVSVEEWTSMKTEEIFEKSGYEESLEKRFEDYNN